jgi:hypothetical protein
MKAKVSRVAKNGENDISGESVAGEKRREEEMAKASAEKYQRNGERQLSGKVMKKINISIGGMKKTVKKIEKSGGMEKRRRNQSTNINRLQRAPARLLAHQAR